MTSTSAETPSGGAAGRTTVVTIVIPLYNGAPFIEDTLRSALVQTVGQIEVIVVDDGSTDGGPAIVLAQSSDHRVVLVSGPHLGVAMARNEGAAHASRASEYLLFLDADDILHPDAIATLIAALDRRTDAAGAFALADYIDSDGNVLDEGDFPAHMRRREDLEHGRLVRRDPTADVLAEHLFLANHVYPPSCLLVRRTAWDLAGGFDGRFLAEDWEFVVRLAQCGPLVPVDRVMVGYRRHASNASGDRSRNVRGARQVWAAVFHTPNRSAAFSEHLRGIWRAHQRRTAARKFSEGRALIARGRLIHGAARTADGVAHTMLLRPPRVWISGGSMHRVHEAGSPAPNLEVPQVRQ